MSFYHFHHLKNNKHQIPGKPPDKWDIGLFWLPPGVQKKIAYPEKLEKSNRVRAKKMIEHLIEVLHVLFLSHMRRYSSSFCDEYLKNI